MHSRSVKYGAGDEIVVDEGDDDGDGHGERARGRACENNVVNGRHVRVFVDNDNNGEDTSTTTVVVEGSYATCRRRG